jgi:hypothetical protein
MKVILDRIQSTVLGEAVHAAEAQALAQAVARWAEELQECAAGRDRASEVRAQGLLDALVGAAGQLQELTGRLAAALTELSEPGDQDPPDRGPVVA